MMSVECPVLGCTEISHSAGRMREHFLYRHFILELCGSAGGDEASDLLQHVRNEYSSGAASQVLEDGKLFQEY